MMPFEMKASPWNNKPAAFGGRLAAMNVSESFGVAPVVVNEPPVGSNELAQPCCAAPFAQGQATYV